MRKIVVIGVIALFIVVSFQSTFAVETIPNTGKVEKEEDCDCQSVSDINLNRLDKTLDRLESYRGLLSLLSKHNPEYEEINEEISNKVSNLKGRIQEIKSYPPVQKFILCFITLMLFLPFWTLAHIIASIPVEPDSILYNIHQALVALCLLPAFYFLHLGNLLECKWTEFVYLYKENSLINPLNKIINKQK